jgi:3-methyl-2-oxobutanoate hydroxymethyltransferase
MPKDESRMSANEKWTAPRIRALKGRRRIACLTAYDYPTARRLDEAGIPIALVGDSVGMTLLGYDTTLPVTLTEMVHHAAAVARGAGRALVVADLPFLTYQPSIADALRSAGRLLKEANVDAVKMEGGARCAETARTLIDFGIPVMGHIGLEPQRVRTMGGYRVQGRDTDAAERLRADARALDAAGCFAIVLEGIPAPLAAAITGEIGAPTIGIGAGPDCDGQVLVVNDLLGLSFDFTPKFVKQYAELGRLTLDAFRTYREDVEEGRFPGAEHTYGATEKT